MPFTNGAALCNTTALTSGMTTTDQQIRSVIHRRLLRKSHADAHTRVVDEMGLHHGSVRADVATINGIIQGFEIKSDADTLSRLPLQIAAYDSIFDKSTLIVGEKHYQKAKFTLPQHWGIVVALRGKKETVKLTVARRATVNKNVDPYSVSQLLWKNEALEIISNLGIRKAPLSGNRARLYTFLVENLSLRQLHFEVCAALKKRPDWKDHVIF